MPELSRNSLSRGIKLMLEHVYTPISSVAGWLSGLTTLVGRAEREQQWVRTRVTWVLPVLGSASDFDIEGTPGGYTAPFILPPLQEFFSTSFLLSETTPEIHLDEIQVSFDQRGEGCLVVADGGQAGADFDNIDFDALSNFRLVLSLEEKIPNKVQGAGNHTYLTTREVASIQLEGAVIVGGYYRQNPLSVPVSRSLNPYRTYVVRLDVDGLRQDNPENGTLLYNLPGLQFTFLLRTPLVARDIAATIQNSPSGNTTRGVESISISTPAADAVIAAGEIPADQTGGSGVAANLMKLEHVFRDKLASGVHKDGAWPVKEHFLEDAGYEVIIVPMWSNMSENGEIVAGTANIMPYSFTTASAETDDHVTANGVRQFLFLDYPIVIHHVFAAVNYTLCQAVDEGRHPTSASYKNFVSVELGCGLRGDRSAYATVASCTWTPTSKDDLMVDRVLEYADTQRVLQPGAKWSHELISVPLVGSGGKGFYAQGHPVYCGKASDLYTPRRDLAGATANTAGQEQWLEFRWIMCDTGGLPFGSQGAAGHANEVYVGQGGHYMVVVCKKMAIGGPGDVLV